MSDLDLSHEAPGDIVVTLRSLPRRFREGFEPRGSGEDVGALAVLVSPADGKSALDHVADTARTLALLGGALSEVVAGREPVLHAALVDRGQREFTAPATDLEGELQMLTDEATQLADRIERIRGEDWQRVGRVAGGGERTSLDLAREAVRVGIDGLRGAERAMEAARS